MQYHVEIIDISETDTSNIGGILVIEKDLTTLEYRRIDLTYFLRMTTMTRQGYECVAVAVFEKEDQEDEEDGKCLKYFDSKV